MSDARRSDPAPRAKDRGLVLLVAAALTLLNAVKPVAVDDPTYLRQAAWWAAHPLDPLGGEALLYQTLVPAAKTASAPVAIGWLALGTRLFGDSPLPLKLWLFPFAWLLAWAIRELLRRAAPGLDRGLLPMMVLSPSILPSFSFMLDVPALALGLAALAVLAGGLEQRRTRMVVAAGLLAGLALQTKYAAAPVLAALVALAALGGQPRAGLLAVLVALGVFAGIEAALHASAGTSPLLEYVAGRPARDPRGHDPLRTGRRLVLLLGSAAPALVPLGLSALRAPRRAVHAALAAAFGGFVLLASAPPPLQRMLDSVTGGRLVNLDNVSIGWMGPGLALIAALAAWRASGVRRPPEDGPRASGRVLARALVVWFAAECAIAPFVSASGSVRRLLGAIVALSLVLAHLARRAVERDPARRADVRAVAVAGVALGLMFWAVDLDSALAERRTLALVLQRTGPPGARRAVAAVGDHWGGFQYEAPRAGLAIVALGRSWLRRGDWLVVPFGVEMRGVELDATRVALVDSVPLVQRLPLTTRRSYFDGRQALRRTDRAWTGATLYRVTADGTVIGSSLPFH